jgi:preprotein translocase subunit SecG
MIVLSAAVVTVATGTFILYMNEKPPRKKTASRLYHVGSCISTFICFALLIATLILLYTDESTDVSKVSSAVKESKPLTKEAVENFATAQETLRRLMKTAIVLACILLFTMAVLYVLFIASCGTAIMCHESHADGATDSEKRNQTATRRQKYQQRGPIMTTTEFSSSTVQNSLDLTEMQITKLQAETFLETVSE